MRKVTLLDTSVASENLGDKIIMNSVWDVMDEVFSDSFFTCVQTHDIIGKKSYAHIKSSDYNFACGTNLLTSRIRIKKTWKNLWQLNFPDLLHVKDITLLGVGWYGYQGTPTKYTSFFFNKILHKDLLHSVRDSYAEQKLKSIGFNNVINTSCPTMWRLTPSFCQTIERKKAENVLFTLTDYNKDPQADAYLVKTLIKNYKNVYFWVQAWDDWSYLESLGLADKIIRINPTLTALDKTLQDTDSLEYIGTRLHAGIRALHYKVRSIIIGIDNRAKEKAKDFNLKVIDRGDLENSLEETLRNDFSTEINIPLKDIERWKSQFK